MFEVADSYDRFMGRYSRLLAPAFASFAGVTAGDRVLDVGCGPGALTGELVRRVGAANVVAAEPSAPFAQAVRERFPEVEVHEAPAEALPFADGTFTVALAQLVVHFMADAVAGVAEMARVTRPGGTVAACVWDVAGERSPMSPLWSAAAELGLRQDEHQRAGTRLGHLGEILEAAGLHDIHEGEVAATVEHPTFDDWWGPFTLGVGPAGAFLAALEPAEVEAVRRGVQARLGDGPFRLTVVAWAARGYH